MQSKYVPLLLMGMLLAATLLSGLMHGKLTNRFGTPQDMNAAAARFENFPQEFGTWRLASEDEMSATVRKTLECAADHNATYINDATGETISMFIVLGPPGPISVHTPEVCYSSKNHDIVEERQRVQIEGPAGVENEFWALTLHSNKVTADMIRVYYGWSNDTAWQAPYSPRMTFGGDTLLMKMQLAAHLPPDTDLTKNDACRNFLEAFLPALNPDLLAPLN